MTIIKAISMKKMKLKHIFIKNLKEFRKKEGLSQMKLAEYCNIAHSYIGEIEVGRKFPSIDVIERIAEILRIKPYHLFIDRTERNQSIEEIEISYPKLPRAMKSEIKRQIDLTIVEGIHEILDKY